MRVLIVKPILPWPPNQGTKRVTVALLSALAPVHDVTLAAPLLSPAEAEAAGEIERTFGCRVLAQVAPNRLSPFHRVWYKAAYFLESLMGSHSPRALYSSPPGLMQAAGELGRQAPFDLVLFEYWYTYRWISRIPSKRKVLLAHDAEFSVNRLAAESDVAGGSRRHWARQEARREIEACKSVDQVWTLTDADAAALAAASGLPRSHFVTMPFGVDVPDLEVPAASSGDSVLFFGAFAADFNRDALGYFLGSIWPLVLAERPTARLVVAGGALPGQLEAEVRAAGGDYFGEVDDIRSLYRDASVVVLPLRYGGGLRIRLLEALAFSRAVVASPVAVAGMAGRDGEHYLVGSTPAEFARSVLDVLAAPEKALHLGRAGRELILERYSRTRAALEVRRMTEAVAMSGPRL